MPFHGRFVAKDPIPVIGYVHTDLDEAFGPTTPLGENLPRILARSRGYALHTIRENQELFASAEFIIAGVWGEGRTSKLDLFGFEKVDPWTKNREGYSWVFVDHIYQPGERNIGCLEMARVVGKEGDHLVTTNSLDDYLRHRPPHMGDLEPRTKTDISLLG